MISGVGQFLQFRIKNCLKTSPHKIGETVKRRMLVQIIIMGLIFFKFFTNVIFGHKIPYYQNNTSSFVTDTFFDHLFEKSHCYILRNLSQFHNQYGQKMKDNSTFQERFFVCHKDIWLDNHIKWYLNIQTSFIAVNDFQLTTHHSVAQFSA